MSKYHALAERDIERLAKDWITQNPHQALRLSVDAHKNWHRCVCALHHLSIDESGRVVRSPRNPCVRVIFMDPTNHIPSVTLFHYLNGSMPLTDDERYHLAHCAYCQSVVAEYKKYIDPAMIPAA